MNSKKIPFYNLLVIFALAALAMAFAFTFRNPLPGQLFGVGMLGLVLLFHPAFWAWLVLSLVAWLGAHFVKTDTGMKVLNWSLVALPFALFIIFKVIVLVRG